MLGPERAAWTVTDYLLARACNLLAGANWQRGGGKGMRPRPVPVPDGKPRRPRAERGREVAGRLANLGLIPGAGHGRDRPLSEREQRLAEALRRAQERNERSGSDPTT